MSDDLINRKALLGTECLLMTDIVENNPTAKYILEQVLYDVEHAETAFDKEKVILELSKKRYEALKMRDDENTSCTTELKSFWHSRLEAYTLAIEVIEKGWIE